MQCELFKTPVIKPSKKSGFDNFVRENADWYRRHAADNARTAEGVILHTGTIRPRFSLLHALNAKSKWYNEQRAVQLAEHALARA